ncbi:MAG: DUF3365 domain-containing protein [Eggerthellaceae bacterium]|nr:DUF3365 domain-containing protein [Eggerthellaceae bacterium]
MQTRILVLLGCLIVVSLLLNVAWVSYTQRQQAERELLEKAEVLVLQTEAVWDFMDINQDRIDTDADGSYNFKGIYCVVAGRTISAFFARDTDYTIRYVNTEPRRKASLADGFETEAFQAFENGAPEYYDYGEYGGEEVFRYVKPVYMTEACLECHGEPAGEIDRTGYAKEGRSLGDLGGAISVVIPTALYTEDLQQGIFQQVVFWFSVILALVVVMFVAVKYLFTRPLAALREATEEVGRGNLDVDLREVGGQAEILDLTLRFQDMLRQLKDLYGGLENQVEIRTMQLESANAMLERQRSQLADINEQLRHENQFKSDFLAIMSHELKTPLTAIIAFAELWEKRNCGLGEDDLVEIREIRENGQLLLQMVSNILETARMEAGKSILEVEPVDLNDLIGLVSASAGFLARQRNIDFVARVASDVPIVDADWEKLRRIIENLVSNAVKYTDEGGLVRLLVRYEEPGNVVAISVEDNGRGIPEEVIPLIFERYVQNKEPSYRHYGDSGSGLGLAVVKELVEMHGGSVEVESERGVGSRFTVRIPVGDREWVGCD